MDNADLEKLKFSAGTLSPAFHKNTTNYVVLLASSEDSVKLTVLTSDSGASYDLKVSGKRTSEKTVKVAEGSTVEVAIDVCSENGSGKKEYQVSISRLSANDASLTNLAISSGVFSPAFSPRVFEYDVAVPASCAELTVKATAADSKMAIDVAAGAKASSVVKLNAGMTSLEVKVTSANGAKTAVYKINIERDHWSFTPASIAWKQECPICLGLLHCPVTTNTTRKVSYCRTCINEVTRTRAVDFVTQEPITGSWISDDLANEKLVSESETECPKCKEKLALRMVADHLKKCDTQALEEEPCSDCSRKIVKGDMEHHKKFICSSKNKEVAFRHSTSAHAWEKQLQSQNPGASKVDDLLKEAKELEKKYRKSVPAKGQPMQFECGQSPLDYLEKAAVCYACMIRCAPKNAEGHFRLGLVQEEIYYLTDIFPIKAKASEDVDDNAAAKASSKDEEFLAICELRGVGADAPLARQLKAVEAEYHALKEQKNQQKAEHVQALYSWKSSQVAKGGAMRAKASDDASPLGRAYVKFCDALACDTSSLLYNLQVGRMLLQQGKASDALARLHAAVAIRPTSIEARFFLGVSLLMGSVADRQKEAAGYLMDGLRKVQYSLRNRVAEPPLHGEQVLRPGSTVLLQGLVSLAQTSCSSKDYQAAMQLSRSVAGLAIRSMVNFPNNRSDTYRQLGWALVDAQSCNLDASLQMGKQAKSQLAERCSRLIALMKSCSIPATDSSLIALQLKTCQQAVRLQPASGLVLCALGEAQLGQFELAQDGDKAAVDLLQLSQLSFRASIDVEGKPVASKDVSKYLAEQSWWSSPTTRISSSGSKAPAATSSSPSKTPIPGPAGKTVPTPSTTGKPAASGRGTPVRGQAPTRGAAAGKPGAAAARGVSKAASTPARGGAAPVRGGATQTTRPGATAASRGGSTAATRGGRTVTATPSARPTTSKATPRPAASAAAKQAAPVSKTPQPAKLVPTGSGSGIKSSARPGQASAGSKTMAGSGPARAKPASAAQAKASAATSPHKAAPAKSEAPKPGPTTTGAASTGTEAGTEEKEAPAVEEEESKEVNKFSHYSRLGLARTLSKQKDDSSLVECRELYNAVITKVPTEHDAYIELAELLVLSDPLGAVDIYSKFPFHEDTAGTAADDADTDRFDDAFIHGEIVRLLMKQEKYDDSRLESNMIAVGRLMRLSYLEKYVKKLEEKFKYKLLMNVYAGVNRKSVDDMDMQAFFKVKCWK